MTDKYNCSQIQAIIQSFDKVFRHTCTVVFCKLMLWLSVDGRKGKIREKGNVEV